MAQILYHVEAALFALGFCLIFDLNWVQWTGCFLVIRGAMVSVESIRYQND